MPSALAHALLPARDDHLAGVGSPLLPLAALVLGAAAGWLLARWLRDVPYRLTEELDRPRRSLAWVVPVSSLLWATLTWRFSGSEGLPYLPTALYLACVGVLLASIDRDVHRLPELLTLPSYAVVIGLLAFASLLTGDWDALVRALLAGLASAGVYGVLFFISVLVAPGGLGFGDVVLSGILGLALGWLSWDSALVGICAAYLLAGGATVVLLVSRRATRKTAIAFGPFMLVGAWVAMILAPATLLVAA